MTFNAICPFTSCMWSVHGNYFINTTSSILYIQTGKNTALSKS